MDTRSPLLIMTSSAASAECNQTDRRQAATSDLDHVLDPAVGVSLDDRLHPDERLDVGVEPVGHQFKLTVRRNERDGAIVVKPRQTDTLMKLDVFQLHRLALTTTSALKQHLHTHTDTRPVLKQHLHTQTHRHTTTAQTTPPPTHRHTTSAQATPPHTDTRPVL